MRVPDKTQVAFRASIDGCFRCVSSSVWRLAPGDNWTLLHLEFSVLFAKMISPQTEERMLKAPHFKGKITKKVRSRGLACVIVNYLYSRWRGNSEDPKT